MSLQFYAEIRGSLNQQDLTKINWETLKKLYQLFKIEKNFFDKLEDKHPSYTERSLFSTLNGDTSRELFMSRLSMTERKNIIILSSLITNWIRQEIKYHDFDTLMAIGSSTYSDRYRSELQKAVNNVNYKVTSWWKKVMYEEWNTSYEDITKEQIQEAINKKGNDIDLVLTWFEWWGIANTYQSYYEDNILKTITESHHKSYRDQLLEQFIYKDIPQEEFFSMVDVDNITWFKSLYKRLQNKNEYWAEEFSRELLKQYKIALSEKWIKTVPPFTNEIITRFLTMKKTIESQEEFVRNTYIKKLIPSLLEKNNIPFTVEEYREDWSYYHIDHTNTTIKKEIYINPSHSKSWCLIIQFPDCRPIHLNVDTSTIQELYHHEQKNNKPFVLLSHGYIERKKFLTTERDKIEQIPEKLSLEEKIKYVRHNKPKIDWERIIEKRKNQDKEMKDNDELPF